MEKISVKLEASYGYGCNGCGYGSEDTIEVEVSDIELEALRKIGSSEISCEDIVRAIDNGETVLQELHEKLEEKFYHMVEAYWLFEAYNECLYESLSESIEQDINDGLYTPTTSEDDEDEEEYDDEECAEETDECDDEENDEDEEYEDEDEDGYDLDAYYEWVLEHEDDHEFVAERVGVDLYACRDDEVCYTVVLDK